MDKKKEVEYIVPEGIVISSDETLLKHLLKLNFIHNRNYETSLHNIITSIQTYMKKTSHITEHLIRELNTTLQKENFHLQAMSIYYFLSIWMRRHEDYEQWKNLRDSLHIDLDDDQVLMFNEDKMIFEPKFKTEQKNLINKLQLDEFLNYQQHIHIDNVFALAVGLNKDNFATLIKNTEKVISINNKNEGYLHCYCDVVATINEDIILNNIKTPDTGKKSIEYHTEKAKSIMKKIINRAKDEDEKSYGKFFSTYGRLLYLSDDTEEANIYINKAISYTSKNDAKALSKLLYYQSKRYNLAMIKQVKSVKSRVEQGIKEVTDAYDKKIESKLDESLKKNLEFVGLFAGIISFLVASITLIANVDVQYIRDLIAVLFCGLVIAFSTIDLVITASSKKWWALINLAVIAAFSAIIYYLI